jgi:hypothetical protein
LIVSQFDTFAADDIETLWADHTARIPESAMGQKLTLGESARMSGVPETDMQLPSIGDRVTHI